MGGLFSKPKIPEPPVVEPPKPMPIPDDQAIKDAKKRATGAQRRRKGRLSTILSETGDLAALGD